MLVKLFSFFIPFIFFFLFFFNNYHVTILRLINLFRAVNHFLWCRVCVCLCFLNIYVYVYV